MRQITLTFDRENYGGWPYRASTQVSNGVLTAGGPTQEAAVENLRREVEEREGDPIGKGYPKVVEVDW